MFYVSDVKHNDTFSSQGTENPPFRFLGDTRYKFVASMIGLCSFV